MLTRLPVHLFSGNFPPPPEGGGRRRSAAGQVAAGLTGLLWLPAVIAVFGLALGNAVLPAHPQGWVYLAAGGLPLGLAWIALGPARPLLARVGFAVAAFLGILACLLAADAGAASQAALAAAMSLPVWLLVLVPRRVRRHAVCVENTVWRVGTITW